MAQVRTKKTPAALLAGILTVLLLAGCAHQPEIIVLDSDVSFEFGQAKLTPEGRKQIDMYIPSLASRGEIRLEIVGHTDRIGSNSANMALSKRRAETVRDQIVSSGRIDPRQITTRGAGPHSPVVYCNQQNRNELIKCLAPNRRVEINVTDIRS